MSVPISHVLALSFLLFGIGLVGVLVRRSLLMVLLCLEVMLNAGGLALVGVSVQRGDAEGQVMFLCVLAVAAAEVAVALALAVRYRGEKGHTHVQTMGRTDGEEVATWASSRS